MYLDKVELRDGSRICIVKKVNDKYEYEDATVNKIDGMSFNVDTEKGQSYNGLLRDEAYLFGDCWYYNL